MMKITWNDSMSVGIPEIDEEHKHFLICVDELNTMITLKSDINQIQKKAQKVIDMHKYHFLNEELMLELSKYPSVKEHKILHRNMQMKFTEYEKALSEKRSGDEVVQIGLNIRNMLVTHIMLEDSAYARYYQWMETMKLIDKNLNKVI